MSHSIKIQDNMWSDSVVNNPMEFERITWEVLVKNINRLVNDVNATNIEKIVPNLLWNNLIRGRGLFCRSCMEFQMSHPDSTSVIVTLVAHVNAKLPQVGNLLLRRIIVQLREAYKGNDKPKLLAAVKFIAHMVNQRVVHEFIALELLTLLLEKPTDDSVEVAIVFLKECGSWMQQHSSRVLNFIFEQFRGILREGEISEDAQISIEKLFVLQEEWFQGLPAIRPAYLLGQEDQLTHKVSLLDKIDPEFSLDNFKEDLLFLKREDRYEVLRKKLLGIESEDETDEDGDAESANEDDEESEEEDGEKTKITDETEANLINLRSTIYLIIISTFDFFVEAGCKLLKIKLEPGQEMELCDTLLKCCRQDSSC